MFITHIYTLTCITDEYSSCSPIPVLTDLRWQGIEEKGGDNEESTMNIEEFTNYRQSPKQFSTV